MCFSQSRTSSLSYSQPLSPHFNNFESDSINSSRDFLSSCTELYRKLKALALGPQERFTQDRWGRDQRNIYIKQFDDAFHMLSDTPLSGKYCDQIRAGYKKFPTGSHIIFYKDGTDSIIQIIRILHKRMDVDLNSQDP